MRLCKVDVQLRGELYQQLVGKLVTIPEIMVLKAQHGETSVFNVVPVPDNYEPRNKHEAEMKATDQHSERERLKRIYGINREDGGKYWADIVFPGSLAKLPDTLEGIGMDANSQAKTMREKAAELLANAKKLEAAATEEGRAKGGAKDAA